MFFLEQSGQHDSIIVPAGGRLAESGYESDEKLRFTGLFGRSSRLNAPPGAASLRGWSCRSIYPLSSLDGHRIRQVLRLHAKCLGQTAGCTERRFPPVDFPVLQRGEWNASSVSQLQLGEPCHRPETLDSPAKCFRMLAHVCSLRHLNKSFNE